MQYLQNGKANFRGKELILYYGKEKIVISIEYEKSGKCIEYETTDNKEEELND